MNIITKIKNWLIDKLEKCKIEIIAFETSRNYAAAQEEKAKHWRDKYNAEYENYLALLNAYNTLAEQKLKPIEMAKALKAYCAEHDTCEGCDLHNTEHCKLSYKACPEYWEVE